MTCLPAYVFCGNQYHSGLRAYHDTAEGEEPFSGHTVYDHEPVGSGLFLIGLSLLYDVTGHLLMSPAKEAVALIEAAGIYGIPMLVILAVISVGLAIKSGLYPFHYWIPDTYGYATPTASAILSGLVSKGYIFLLIKIFYRALGREM